MNNQISELNDKDLASVVGGKRSVENDVQDQKGIIDKNKDKSKEPLK